MIHKTGTNLRNDEIWRLLLLVQIPTFGELDKINIMSNCWKRNKITWHLLQQGVDLRKMFESHTHLVQHWADFFQSLHMSICQKASITQWNLLKKHLLNFSFLVSPNVFHSYLGASVGPSQMKIFSLLIIKTFLFETLFFHKNSSTFVPYNNFLLKFCNQKKAAEIEWNIVSKILLVCGQGICL